jgi:hypothetical protein
VYVSPDLLGDLVHYAKDLRLGPSDHFFTSNGVCCQFHSDSASRSGDAVGKDADTPMVS